MVGSPFSGLLEGKSQDAYEQAVWAARAEALKPGLAQESPLS